MTIAHLDQGWEAWTSELDSLRSAIAKRKTTLVGDIETMERGKRLVMVYFRAVRPELEHVGVSGSLLAAVDAPLQSLLVLAGRANRRTTYKNTLATTQAAVTPIEIERSRVLGAIEQRSRRGAAATPGSVEAAILSTLDKLVPSAAKSYRQALADLQDHSRFSYRGAAHELREALREVLDRLAPDAEVAKAPGYKQEPDAKKPTQRQKALFVLRARNTGKNVEKSAALQIDMIDELAAHLARSAYDVGSVTAHTESTRQQAVRARRYVETVLAELLNIPHDGHVSSQS
jgi:hypothetical protein